MHNSKATYAIAVRDIVTSTWVISPDDDNITISHGETTITQKKEILLQARNGLVQDDDNCSKCSSRI